MLQDEVYLYNVFMESIHVTPCGGKTNHLNLMVASIARRMTFLSIWLWVSHNLEALNGTNSRLFSLFLAIRCVRSQLCGTWSNLWAEGCCCCCCQAWSRSLHRSIFLSGRGLIFGVPPLFFLSFTWKGEWEAVHVCRNTVPGGKQTKYSFSTADLPVTTYWQQWHSRPMLHSSAFVEHNSCSVYSSPCCPRLRSLYFLSCQGIVTSSSHSTVHLENRQ